MRNYFKSIGKSAIKQIIGMRNYFKSIGKEPGRQLRARHGRPGLATHPTRPPTSANTFQLRTPPPLHHAESVERAGRGEARHPWPTAPRYIQPVANRHRCDLPGYLRPASPAPTTTTRRSVHAAATVRLLLLLRILAPATCSV